jgi:uncharacterized protein YqgC (DUF456 family)
VPAASDVSEAILTVVLGLVMLLGVAGVFVPLLPDVLLIWLAALGYGILVEWGRWGPYLFALIIVLGVISWIAEYLLSGLGARIGGGSYWGIVAGGVLGMIGFIVLPPFGALIGMLLGLFLVEFYRLRDLRQAAKATFGMGLGYGLSYGVRLMLALMMTAAWFLWVYLNSPR